MEARRLKGCLSREERAWEVVGGRRGRNGRKE